MYKWCLSVKLLSSCLLVLASFKRPLLRAFPGHP